MTATDGVVYYAIVGEHRLGNDDIAFVAKDVAERLGYKWNANLIKHIPDEWKGGETDSYPGGMQEMAALIEQGLFFRVEQTACLPFQMWIGN
jgi:prophage antirepressor-like protein